MKALVKVVFFQFSLLLGFMVNAQYNSNIDEIINYASGVQSFDSRFNGVVGSSYLNDEFLEVTIGENEKIYSLRYNAFRNEMEFEKDGKLLNLLKKNGLEIFFINDNKQYRVFEYNEENKKENGFFVVAFKGNSNSFLIREQVKFYEEVKPKSGYDAYKPPTLKRETDKFYYSVDSKSALKFPNKKKEIFLIFDSKSKEIEKYVKEERLNVKSKGDIIEIFKYYDQLK